MWQRHRVWRRGRENTGSENYGAPIVTAGGLVFIAATNFDNTFRAFDQATGEIACETRLPLAGNATPSTYEVDGRQFIVVPAGGRPLTAGRTARIGRHLRRVCFTSEVTMSVRHPKRSARVAAGASLVMVVATFGVGAQRRDYPTRPPAEPAAVERGKAIYGVNCQFCHGADTRGGDSGPSLLRSGIVLDDDQGERIAPVVRAGRPGMPKFALTDDQIADVAAFVHTFRAAGYDESRLKPASIVVGDVKAGEMFFSRKCASCHSPTGDLQGIATKVADARLLQQTWLLPGSGAGRGGPPPVQVKPTTVIVTLRSGEKIDGRLDHIDDFVVALTQADGTRRSFRTDGDTPPVEIHDPLQPHKDLLRTYSDSDIHNVTAYLVTLK